MSTYYTDEHGINRCIVCDAPEGYEEPRPSLWLEPKPMGGVMKWAEAMQEIAQDDDIEDCHVRADALMVTAIIALAIKLDCREEFQAFVDAYEAMPKWYA